MTDELQRVFDCPKCALRMTIQDLAEPAQITCPSCFCRLLIEPGSPPVEPQQPDLAEFSQLPEPIIIHTEVARPATRQRIIRRAAKRAHRDSNLDQIRKDRVKRLQVVAASIVGLLCTTTAVALSYRALSQLSEESWSRVIPGKETAPEVVEEFGRICAEFRSICESVANESSRDRATGKIRGLASMLETFPDRVNSLVPLTPTQRAALGSDFMVPIQRERESALQSLRQARSKRLLYEVEYFSALQRFADGLGVATDAINEGWTI